MEKVARFTGAAGVGPSWDGGLPGASARACTRMDDAGEPFQPAELGAGERSLFIGAMNHRGGVAGWARIFARCVRGPRNATQVWADKRRIDGLAGLHCSVCFRGKSRPADSRFSEALTTWPALIRERTD